MKWSGLTAVRPNARHSSCTSACRLQQTFFLWRGSSSRSDVWVWLTQSTICRMCWQTALSQTVISHCQRISSEGQSALQALIPPATTPQSCSAHSLQHRSAETHSSFCLTLPTQHSFPQYGWKKKNADVCTKPDFFFRSGSGWLLILTCSGGEGHLHFGQSLAMNRPPDFFQFYNN